VNKSQQGAATSAMYRTESFFHFFASSIEKCQNTLQEGPVAINWLPVQAEQASLRIRPSEF
jgi:hypothetical protein